MRHYLIRGAPRAVPAAVLVWIVAVLPSVHAQSNGYSLRFHGNGSGDYGDYRVSLSSGRLGFGVHNGTWGNTIYDGAGGTVVTDGSRHHVAVTRDQSSGEMRNYGGAPSGPLRSTDAPFAGFPVSATPRASGNTLFGVIGDYGSEGEAERDVASLVTSWSPDFIVTAGDNNYPDGSAATIDDNIGQYYSNYIYPYTGSYGSSAAANLFFPALGNHDWRTAGAHPYLDYFTLPGNERYYDLVRGPVHIFVLDTAANEPDGTSSGSTQGTWLRNALASSISPWKLVIAHHPPYSSSLHGSSAYMQWPFREWGATAVISAHDHSYERIVREGLPYFVNGLGGLPSIYPFGTPVSGSRARYNGDYGAMRAEADGDSVTFRFITRSRLVVDTCEMDAGGIVDNYVEIGTDSDSIASGGGMSIWWECDVGRWNYAGVPVNVYVAAIRGPVVAGSPSSVADVLSGAEVYLFGEGMRSVYRYTGSVREPAWRGVVFPPASISGTKKLTVPADPALAGDWVFATAFVRLDTGRFVRDDGLPVESSHIFSIQ